MSSQTQTVDAVVQTQPSKDDVNILVVPSSAVPWADGFTPGQEWDLRRLLRGAEFRRRGDMETDPARKQVIPYVIIARQSDGRVLAYRRTKSGGESRLHDRWSVGIGGHVDAADGSEGFAALRVGLGRELAEEVGVELAGQFPRFAGFVLDQSDDVGRVHVGAVFIHWVQPHGTEPRAQELAIGDACWIAPGTPAAREAFPGVFENWSRHVLGAWSRLRVPPHSVTDIVLEVNAYLGQLSQTAAMLDSNDAVRVREGMRRAASFLYDQSVPFEALVGSLRPTLAATLERRG